MDNDSTRLEINVLNTRLDEWQRKTCVELEDIVRHARRDILHAPERCSVVPLDREPNEVEDVVLALFRRRQRIAVDLEHGAARRLAVEADDDAAAGTLGLDGPGGGAAAE